MAFDLFHLFQMITAPAAIEICTLSEEPSPSANGSITPQKQAQVPATAKCSTSGSHWSFERHITDLFCQLEAGWSQLQKLCPRPNKHLKYNATWISNASEQTPSSLPVKGCSPLLGLETWEVDFEGAKTQDGASHQYLYWNHVAFTSFAFNRHFFESRVNNGTRATWKMLAFLKCPPWHVQVRKGLVARPTGPLVFIAKDDLQWRPHAHFNNGKPSCIKFPDAPQTLWGHWTKSASEILFTPHKALELSKDPHRPSHSRSSHHGSCWRSDSPGDRSQPAAEFRMFLPAHPAPLTLERSEQWVRGI